MSALARGVELDRRAVDDLATSFGGSLIRPDDPTYDEQRLIWNGSIDRRPGLIARCAGVADVISAVRFARDQEQLVAVRSGRHSYPGLCVCDGGMVIDLGQMKGIRVDPEARTARAQAGVLLGDLDREAQAFGLAVPAGIVTHTGLAGLTLGGGIGWLERKYGLTIDQLLSVDLVTAEGELVRASEEENADLFWGRARRGRELRHRHGVRVPAQPGRPDGARRADRLGDGGLPEGPSLLPGVDQEVPDELTTIVTHRRVPPVPAMPEELHGRHAVMVGTCYAGPVEEGESVLRPLRRVRLTAARPVRPVPFTTTRRRSTPASPTTGGTTSAPATWRS